ncbi:PH domain-containing protein [Actinoplanes sp. LDG1-06]|uniref:PH domain-containing protein n=1 Tax=Paractinoplanes ovalisporus TaxID=2810368 RepID=A0ABS2ACC2_9ACTN|nr:PH domain-containing protein [Actinoplanes ovalisporus]MBM2617476.1 PH domain-containing protein [Actinoplanes ovalisporus]
MRSQPLLRVRRTGALMVAAAIAFVGGIPLTGESPWFAVLLLIPAAVYVWAWRAGTDVYPGELRVRALFGSTPVPWDRISELAPGRRGQISALLDNGNIIRLTAVTTGNLPRVLAAGGQEIGHSDQPPS